MAFRDIRWIVYAIQALLGVSIALGLSVPENTAKYSLFDRFDVTCPADIQSIELFDPKLLEDDSTEDDGSTTWVAVHRSNNNKPSVMIKDEFLHAMRAAVDPATPQQSTAVNNNDLESSFVQKSQATAPVAVARLRPSPDYDDCYVLDNMRCVLKKENTDETCDGGSEHAEALSTGIDALLLHYLSKHKHFEGAIRTKATLVSGVLLEARGFEPVEDFTRDMASHTSSIEACLTKFAERSVNKVAKSPGAMQRALSIMSALGSVDREADLQRAAEREDGDRGAADDVDPWSGMKSFF